MLNENAIETISVNAVKNSIVSSPYLDQFIADNDKAPSWDGHVNIYKDKSKTKSKLKGRLPIQIKGKICSDFSKDNISYSMKIDDLKNYLYDGGAVLFVVYMNDNGSATQIYYSALTPVKLRNLLDDAGEQKTKTVKLKKFPEDEKRKVTIFFDCLQNCQRQASFADAPLYSLEELEKTGLLESISVSFEGVGVDDPISMLFTNEPCFYANIKGSAIPQPIKDIPINFVVTKEVSSQVTIDGIVYYQSYFVFRNANSITLQFGESFSIVYEKEKGVCSVKYKPSTKMRTIAVDLDFMLSCIEKGYFEIENVKFPFDKVESVYKGFDVEKEKVRLSFVQRSIKVLDMLSCKADLDLSKLSVADFRNLERLAVAFLDKEPVKDINPNLPSVCIINIGDLKFLLLFKKCEEENGGYYIFDYFRSDIRLAYENEDGDKVDVSQYSLLKADNLRDIQNIRPDVLLPSFEKINNDEKYINANYFLLELLKAYDKSGDTRKDLLKVADDFSVWLLNAPEQCITHQIKLINRYQVIKRERALNADELTELWEIADSNSSTEFYKFGAFLLLDQQIPAKKYFSKLDKETQEEFKTYPIFRYYKPQEKSQNGQAQNAHAE